MPKACKSSKSNQRNLWKKNTSRHNKKGQEVLDLHAVSGKGILGRYQWMFAFVITVPGASTYALLGMDYTKSTLDVVY